MRDLDKISLAPLLIYEIFKNNKRLLNLVRAILISLIFFRMWVRFWSKSCSLPRKQTSTHPSNLLCSSCFKYSAAAKKNWSDKTNKMSSSSWPIMSQEAVCYIYSLQKASQMFRIYWINAKTSRYLTTSLEVRMLPLLLWSWLIPSLTL